MRRAWPLVAALWVAGLAQAAPTTQFTVTGAVRQPSTNDAAALQALPAITQTVTFSAAGKPQTHTYTGASLWSVLGAAGVVTDPKVKNDVLRKVVLATGGDGYRTVFSLGELAPTFGNRPDLVAYSETVGGIDQPLGPDGFARVTAPGDGKGGRYVSNLANLDVRDAGSAQHGTGGGASKQFAVSGAVTNGMSFELAALQALPSVSQTVNGHVYTGVSLWSLLSTTVGIALDPAVKNDVLGKYVVATGSDGYKAAFSLGELSDAFGNQPDLIAYAMDGALLTDTGFARLVVPNDVRAGRWVSNLVGLEVLTAAPPVPEPAASASLLMGLVAVGWAVRRRVGTRR